MHATRKKFGLTIATLALLGAAACGKSTPVDDALNKDLALASAAGTELASSNANDVQVVSAIERTGTAVKETAAPKKSATPRVTPKPSPKAEPQAAPEAQPDPTPAPEPVKAETPAPAPKPQPEVTPRPRTAPRPAATARAPRRGGYWTTGDVIRNAPFPINP